MRRSAFLKCRHITDPHSLLRLSTEWESTRIWSGSARLSSCRLLTLFHSIFPWWWWWWGGVEPHCSRNKREMHGKLPECCSPGINTGFFFFLLSFHGRHHQRFWKPDLQQELPSFKKKQCPKEAAENHKMWWWLRWYLLQKNAHHCRCGFMHMGVGMWFYAYGGRDMVLVWCTN